MKKFRILTTKKKEISPVHPVLSLWVVDKDYSNRPTFGLMLSGSSTQDCSVTSYIRKLTKIDKNSEFELTIRKIK